MAHLTLVSYLFDFSLTDALFEHNLTLLVYVLTSSSQLPLVHTFSEKSKKILYQRFINS